MGRASGRLFRAALLVALAGGCGDDGVAPDPDMSMACPTGTFSPDGMTPDCEPWTECPAGTAVSIEGTSSSDRACEPCAEGTFSDEANAPSCEPHRSCDVGTYRRGDGSPTTDTDCESCGAGTYTDTMDAASCMSWTVCEPGQFVEQNGFVTADRVCAPCPAETHSGTINAEECEPFTRCSPWLEVAMEGTASSDRTCRPWVRQFGTGEDDEVTDLLVDGSGDLFLVGTTDGALPGEASAGGSDGFVQRRDAEGNVRWTTQLGTTEADSLATVGLDGAGHVVVAGTTAGTFPGESAGGLTDAFVAQLDATTGALRWVRQVGTAEAEAGSAAVDSSGDVVVAGSTRGTLPDQSNGGGADAFVRKYDPAGTELWTVQIGTAADELVYEVAAGLGGALFVVGEIFASTWDAFVWKLSATGSVDWTRELDSGADDGAYHAVVDGAGGVVVGGYTTGTFPDETSGGATDVAAWSLSAAGATRWVRQIGSGADEWAANIALVPGGDVVVVGATPGVFPGQTSFGGTDGFAHRFDGEGMDRWTRQFGSESSDAVLAVAHTDGGYMLIAGRARGTLPGETNLGGADAFLARLDP